MHVRELLDEGVIVRLLDEKGEFIGRGYYGIQNKGIGWILTTNEKETIEKAFIKKKLIEAFTRRKKYFDDPETTAFRLFNSEGDGIGGLTIDYFADYYLIQWYSEGIYTFKDKVIQSLKE